MKLYAVEGNTQKLDGGAMFGNAPKALWSRWIEPAADNRIPLACRALLVETDDGRNILFEVGIGSFFDKKLKDRYGVDSEEHDLLLHLRSMGLEEGDIDAVVLSHLHFDHAGGLLPPYDNGPPQLLFPNAKYYVGKSHWEYAHHPHPREKASFIPLLHELLEKSDRLELIDQPTHPDLNWGVSFRFSEGHTIGLMLSQIALETGPVIFVSDLIPGAPWVHLPITMGYDRFPELKVDEKRELYEAVIDKHAKLFFTHDPKIACGELKKDEEGKFLIDPIIISDL